MSTHNLIFQAKIRKIMYTPVNPSFTIKKWGLRESKLYRHVFIMKKIYMPLGWKTILSSATMGK